MDHYDDGTNEGQHSLSLAYETYLRHDESEKNHFDDVCQAYRQYATFAMAHYSNHQFRLHSLPENQRAALPSGLKHGSEEFNQRAAAFKEAAIRNQFCLDCILRHTGTPHSQQVSNVDKVVTDDQMSKVSSVLKSLARDWSAEGKEERDMAYGPIIDHMKKYLPLEDHAIGPRPKICVPGAGVGRLAFELTKLGYSVQGNEFSLFMLFASDFILNGGVATPDRPLSISPWMLESRNCHSTADAIRPVCIPDVDPGHILSADDDGSPMPEFSMAAGEFISVYAHDREVNQWDAVASSFFLDAMPNIVECLQLIYRILKPGGILVNFGPLLFHWSGPAMRPDDKSIEGYRSRFRTIDKRYMESIDLTYEDIRDVMRNIGFDILEEQTGINSLYTADNQSMLSMSYKCVSFVARKPFGPHQSESESEMEEDGGTEKENQEDQDGQSGIESAPES